MNNITDQNIQEILKLIDNKKWEEVEEVLMRLAKTEDSRIYYYLGHVFDAWDNKKKDIDIAKRYFRLAAQSVNPIETAFIRLARIENSYAHSIRVLRNGLKSFPKSEAIYYQLFIFSELSQRENIFKEIIEQKCVSERIIINMAMTFFTLKKFENAINVLFDFNAEEEWNRNIMACIKGFSFYETNNNTEASKIFSKLIEDDINHKLNYIPFFGLILILLNQNMLSQAEQLIEEIPLDEEIYQGAYPIVEPGPWGESYFDASDYFLKAIDLITTISKEKKINAIAKGLRGLFLYSRAFEEDLIKKKLQSSVIKDLNAAKKEFPQNKEITKHLFLVFKETNPFKAWQYLIQYALLCDKEIDDIEDFIENVNNQIFINIYNNFKDKLSDYYFAEKLAKPFLKPIIGRLYKAKKYKDIVETINRFNDLQLTACDLLFETAFSFHEEKNLKLSKKYYELYLKTETESSAANNNLGLIFEETGELLKAKELFQKAVKIDSEDKIARKNLKRVEDEMKEKWKSDYELQEAIEKYRNESPYVQKKILDFYSNRNEDGLIICSYRQAPQRLKMSGAKATDFLNDLLTKKFFIKVTDHEYDTQSNVYRLNPYLKKELAKISG